MDTLRDRFRKILAEHGRVPLDEIDAVLDELIQAVEEKPSCGCC